MTDGISSVEVFPELSLSVLPVASTSQAKTGDGVCGAVGVSFSIIRYDKPVHIRAGMS